MSVSTSINRVQYAGSNTAGPFGFGYPVQALTDIQAAIQDTVLGTITPLTQNNDYTLTGTLVANFGYQGGVSLTLKNTTTIPVLVGGLLPSGYNIVIFRTSKAIQNAQLPQSGPLPSRGIEAAMDELALSMQRSNDIASRSLALPDGYSKTFNPALPPDMFLNPGSPLAVNSTGDGISYGPSATSLNNAVALAQAAAAASATSATSSAASASSIAGAITTQGDLVIGNGSGAAARLPIGANGYILTSNGTTAVWGVAPTSGFANPMTTSGDLIQAGAGGTAARLGIGANGYVLTSNGTSAGWAAPTGGGGFTNPMTAAYDLIIGGASGVAGRLGIGSANQVLTVNSAGTAVSWAAAATGFTNPMTTLGDIIYEGAGPAPARLGIGGATQLLGVVAGIPAWVTVASVPAASTYAGWDANKNLAANNVTESFATTATAAGTTTLTVSSAGIQQFTGTTTQTVVLPVVSTLPQTGFGYYINNRSTGALTVNSSGGNLVQTIAAGAQALITCALLTGTTAASWDASYSSSGGFASPQTTKGDMITYSTVPARHAVPGDYGSLVADAAQADGWRSKAFSETNGLPGKNLIQYSDFENQATTGWALGTVGTLTNGIPTGTPNFAGTTTSLALAASTTSPIEGAAHLLLTASAASTVGNMVASTAITIPPSHQGKVVNLSHLYSTLTGATNLNYSGTLSNSLAMALWDVTNSAWVPVVGNFNYVQNSQVPTASAQAQLPINITSARLCLYFPTASAGAFTLGLKNFYLGMTPQVQGAAMSDEVAYTPTITGFGTPTAVSFFSRRVGQYLEVRGSFVSGTPTATAALITLGFNGGNGNVTQNSGQVIIGHGNINAAASTYFGIDVLGFGAAGSSNQIAIGSQTSTTSSAAIANGNALISSGVQLALYARVPIVGWSSNTVQSSDANTRVVTTTVTGSSTSIAPSTNTKIVFPTVASDKTGAWDAGNTRFKVGVTGSYRVTSLLITAASQAFGANSLFSHSVFKNGVVARQLGWNIGTGTYQFGVSGSAIVDCVAGDYLEVYCFQNAGGTITLDGANSNMVIDLLNGPAIVQQSEAVNCSYANGAGTAFSGSAATVPFATKYFDSHNAWNGTTFTCPTPGKYRWSGNITYGPMSLSLTQVAAAFVAQAGSKSVTKYVGYASGTGGTASYYSMNGSATFDCLAGDTLILQTFNQGTSPALITGAANNHMEIELVK